MYYVTQVFQLLFIAIKLREYEMRVSICVVTHSIKKTPARALARGSWTPQEV